MYWISVRRWTKGKYLIIYSGQCNFCCLVQLQYAVDICYFYENILSPNWLSSSSPIKHFTILWQFLNYDITVDDINVFTYHISVIIRYLKIVYFKWILFIFVWICSHSKFCDYQNSIGRAIRNPFRIKKVQNNVISG